MISHRQANAQRIAALDERAEALHLKRGMGIADARAMHPSIDVVEADPEADRRLLESLADWCDRYTPLVALDAADGLFLDVTGCTHLFGGERSMLDDILSRFFYQGFDVRAGLAATPGAAWAVAPLSVERHLAEPIMLTDEIERLVKMLATTLKVDLERRGEGARRLALLLFRVDGAVSRIAVGTSRPLREPLLIQKLFHERLAALEQDIDAGYGFDLVRLSVLSAAAFDMQQADLAGETRDDGADIALFADRIRARLGDSAVLKPVAVESHLPERAVATLPFAEAPQRVSPPKKPDKIQDTKPGFRPERPIRLFRSPEPIEVPATEMPEGPPMNFRWRRALYRVARAEGPERIAPEWWREAAGQEDAPTRDYFRIEDSDGRRYWLYRQGLYGASQVPPRWFMHGVFA
ncbi:MAG: DNA polymerase Y family protein [Mesorhizobium sp.]|nr:MAG: DNA polymerase Y family protein [Mesorhizobium sp.]